MRCFNTAGSVSVYEFTGFTHSLSFLENCNFSHALIIDAIIINNTVIILKNNENANSNIKWKIF